MGPEFITNETPTGVTLRWKHNLRAIKTFKMGQKPENVELGEDAEVYDLWDLNWSEAARHWFGPCYTIEQCYWRAVKYAEAILIDLGVWDRPVVKDARLKGVKELAEAGKIAEKAVI